MMQQAPVPVGRVAGGAPAGTVAGTPAASAGPMTGTQVAGQPSPMIHTGADHAMGHHHGLRQDKATGLVTSERMRHAAAEEPAGLANMASGVWINVLVAQLWPWLKKFIEDIVKVAVPVVLKATKPGWAGDVWLDHADLGKIPPTVTSLQVIDQSEEDLAWGGVLLHAELCWHTDELEVQMRVQPLPHPLEKLLPHKLRDKVKDIAEMQVGVKRLKLKAKAQIRLAPLRAALPILRAIQVSLLEPPEELDVGVTVSEGLNDWPTKLIRPWLGKAVERGSMSLMLPDLATFVVDLHGQPFPPVGQTPAGVLMVRVLKARHMPKRLNKKSEVYMRVGVRQRSLRTTHRTSWSDGVPVWYDGTQPRNESPCMLLVQQPVYQPLLMEYWEVDDDALTNTHSIRAATRLPLTDHAVLSQPGRPHIIEAHLEELAGDDEGALIEDVGTEMRDSAIADGGTGGEKGGLVAAATHAAGWLFDRAKRVAGGLRHRHHHDRDEVEEPDTGHFKSALDEPAMPTVTLEVTYVPRAMALQNNLQGTAVLYLTITKVLIPVALTEQMPFRVQAALIRHKPHSAAPATGAAMPVQLSAPMAPASTIPTIATHAPAGNVASVVPAGGPGMAGAHVPHGVTATTPAHVPAAAASPLAVNGMRSTGTAAPTGQALQAGMPLHAGITAAAHAGPVGIAPAVGAAPAAGVHTPAGATTVAHGAQHTSHVGHHGAHGVAASAGPTPAVAPTVTTAAPLAPMVTTAAAPPTAATTSYGANTMASAMPTSAAPVHGTHTPVLPVTRGMSPATATPAITHTTATVAAPGTAVLPETTAAVLPFVGAPTVIATPPGASPVGVGFEDTPHRGIGVGKGPTPEAAMAAAEAAAIIAAGGSVPHQPHRHAHPHAQHHAHAPSPAAGMSHGGGVVASGPVVTTPATTATTAAAAVQTPGSPIRTSVTPTVVPTVPHMAARPAQTHVVTTTATVAGTAANVTGAVPAMYTSGAHTQRSHNDIFHRDYAGPDDVLPMNPPVVHTSSTLDDSFAKVLGRSPTKDKGATESIELLCGWDCVWDLVGPHQHVFDAALRVGLLPGDAKAKDSTAPDEGPAARVTDALAEVILPLKDIATQAFPHTPGVSGGKFNLEAPAPGGKDRVRIVGPHVEPRADTIKFELVVSLHPLAPGVSLHQAVEQSGEGAVEHQTLRLLLDTLGGARRMAATV